MAIWALLGVHWGHTAAATCHDSEPLTLLSLGTDLRPLLTTLLPPLLVAARRRLGRRITHFRFVFNFVPAIVDINNWWWLFHTRKRLLLRSHAVSELRA